VEFVLHPSAARFNSHRLSPHCGHLELGKTASVHIHGLGTGVSGGAAVANTLLRMFFEVVGKDPAGWNAGDGGAGSKGGGEEEGNVEDPFFHRIDLQLSP